MREKVKIISSCLLLLLVTFRVAAQDLPMDEVVPGGIVKINLDVPYDPNKAYPQAYFQDNKILVFAHNEQYYGLVGLPLNLATNSNYKIKYLDRDGNAKYQDFAIKDKKYNISKIKIKNKNMVEPDLKTQQIIANDTKRIKSAVDNFTEQLPTHLTFRQPLSGVPSTSFGARRIINGQKKNPHGGMDIPATQNTPVFAASDGKVVLADNFYLSGNMVAIDHGHGLVTMYAHLNKILAKVGDDVKVGDKIGLVGSTGRVTGPHLHWTVKLNKTSVNPALFIDNHNQKEAAGL